MQAWIRSCFFILALLHAVALVLFVHGTVHEFYDEQTIPAQHRLLEVKRGETFRGVLERLHQKGLCRSPGLARMIIKLKGEEVVIKAGSYRLPERASTWDIIQTLHHGDVVLFKLTVPEGLDIWEAASLLGQSQWGTEKEFLQLVQDASMVSGMDAEAVSLEGYLFPETYFFPESASSREVVRVMVEAFQEHIDPLRSTLAEKGLSLREWVTLASLVEEESGRVDERKLIAGVFFNRLARGMLLQCDPTIVYGLKARGVYRGKIYKSQIHDPHPYNTYVHAGLPPGPISSPGMASLEAVLFPTPSDYLYFVSKNDGSHHFSRTHREHLRAVRKYQR